MPGSGCRVAARDGTPTETHASVAASSPTLIETEGTPGFDFHRLFHTPTIPTGKTHSGKDCADAAWFQSESHPCRHLQPLPGIGTTIWRSSCRSQSHRHRPRFWVPESSAPLREILAQTVSNRAKAMVGHNGDMFLLLVLLRGEPFGQHRTPPLAAILFNWRRRLGLVLIFLSTACMINPVKAFFDVGV